MASVVLLHPNSFILIKSVKKKAKVPLIVNNTITKLKIRLTNSVGVFPLFISQIYKQKTLHSEGFNYS